MEIKQLSTYDVLIKSEAERTFEGFVTVETIDAQNEITVRDELLKTMDVWLNRGGPMSYGHSNRIIGKGLEYESLNYKLSSGAEVPAIKIKAKIYHDTVLDDIVWAGIKNGTLKGLSYGGATKSPKEVMVQPDGSLAYKLKNLEMYEVAVCEKPVNNFAIITSFNSVAKSIPVDKLAKGYDREDGTALYQCDGIRCVVDKSENTLIKPNNPTSVEEHMAETIQVEKSLTAEDVKEIVKSTMVETLKDLKTVSKEDKEDEKTETSTAKEQGDEEVDESDKGYVDVESFNKLVGLVTDHVNKSSEDIANIVEVLRADSGQGGENLKKKNGETTVLPDEDSEQATQQPTNDNSTDEVKVAKSETTDENSQVVKGERPEIEGVDKALTMDSMFGQNPILEDAQKGIPMDKITEKIRLRQYEGMNTGVRIGL